MIQRSEDYTGSTEHNVSGSDSPSKIDGISSNQLLKLNQTRDISLGLSKDNLLVTDWLKPGVNCVYNSLSSGTIKAQTTQLTSSDAELPKILVVDDHSVSRMTAVTLLGMEGYAVIEADGGAAAIELVKQQQPDLILLDVMMPEIDGFEVCQTLKQDEQTRLIPIIFVTALHDRRSRIRGIEVGADDFISKPFDRLELIARVKSLVKQKLLNEDLDHAAQALFSIASAIESRDATTGDHCDRLVRIGKAFGEYLHLSRYQIRDLMWGSYLHDIGKVGIPDAVLLKKDKLTPDEWLIMKQHVLIGEKICQPLRSMQSVIPIIRHHHERWDGSGYPDGLKGDKIPYLAQVFQIIDIYDALTSERPYKKPFSSEEALSIMLEEVKSGWRNPTLIKQFAEFILLRQ